MSVDDLRAKAVDVWEKVPNAGTFRAVRLSDAVAVVERAERRVRDLEASLSELAAVAEVYWGGSHAETAEGDAADDALERQIIAARALLASSPEGPDPDGEARIEYRAVRIREGMGEYPWPVMERASAFELSTEFPSGEVRVEQRTVITGPWVPVTEHEDGGS